jgi:hypothetical protein
VRRVSGEERAGARCLEVLLRDRACVGERDARGLLRTAQSERSREARERARRGRQRAEQHWLDGVPLLDEG